MPVPAAFHKSSITGIEHQYPDFGRLCTWQTLLEQVANPVLTWECWGPDTLGAYSSCTDVWRAWVEGSLVEGVGQRAPLQMVESQWGAKKDAQTNKGRQQSWRPTGDTNVISHITGLATLANATSTLRYARNGTSSRPLSTRYVRKSRRASRPQMRSPPSRCCAGTTHCQSSTLTRSKSRRLRRTGTRSQRKVQRRLHIGQNRRLRPLQLSQSRAQVNLLSLSVNLSHRIRDIVHSSYPYYTSL